MASIPELLVYGDYDPDSRTGPAIWLRCMIDRTLETPPLPEDAVPILCLPGVGRQQLRAGEECLDALKPLVELMYRGTLWLQKGGHDWTAIAFLTSPNGLKLSGDDLTTEALLRTLPEFASEPIARFRGQRLEAADFDQMLAADVVRDLLLWMNNPAGTHDRLSEDRWAAFRNQYKQQFDFNPDTDGETTAGERLGAGDEELFKSKAREAGAAADGEDGPNESDPSLMFTYYGDASLYGYVEKELGDIEDMPEPLELRSDVDVIFEVNLGWNGINYYGFRAPRSG